MQIQRILVDDSTFHREVLSDLLQENYPEIGVAGKAQNGSDALDYLLKPIKLAQAIHRFRASGYVPHNQVQVQLALENLKKENTQEQVLFLPTQEGGINMILQDILKIEGDRNYSTFYLTDDKTKISSKTLGYFVEILHGKGFFRCHRSSIMNRFQIDNMKGDFFFLKNGDQVPISRRRKSDAKAWFYHI